jgi:hypothetical protein
MMKLGQLQTAITGVQSGSSEKKKTVFQFGAHVFSKCSPAYTYVSFVISNFFFFGGGTTKIQLRSYHMTDA